MKILGNIGITKLIDLIASKFALLGHMHTGTEVTLTGYSKAENASAVAATDTTNAAIGKLEKALDGKQASGNYAAASHGNHVPATETVNNAKFLRNDNTWQTVTPANIGAAAASHTHVGTEATLTGYSKASTAAAVAATDTVNTAIGKLEKNMEGYLPLTGGTLTGTLWIQGEGATAGLKLNEAGKNIDFGWDWSTYAGAGFALRGAAHSGNGAFIFFARNSSNTTQLTGTPAGALTWGGSSFTVGSGTGTISGNITGNVLTGYSKPSATSAIAATDTLNAAIGKLEKALDGKQASGSYAASSHNHDGRYIYWDGTSANNSAWTWGTLTVANGYTQHSHLTGPSSSEGGFASKGGQLSMQLDGFFYQNEGRYQCLDTNSSLNAAKLTGTVPASCYTNTVYTHPNTVTAGTVGTSSATSGSTLAVPYITYNANGHVTATGTHTHTVSGFLPLSGGTITGSLTLNSAFIWPAPANVTCTFTESYKECSFDMSNVSYTGTYWHVWSGKNSKSCIICYNDNCNVTVPSGTFTASKDILMNGTSGTNYIQLPSGIKLY